MGVGDGTGPSCGVVVDAYYPGGVVNWTVDVPIDELPELPPLPGDLQARFADAMSRPALQQPSWDPEDAHRMRTVLESVPPICMPAEVEALSSQLADVAEGTSLTDAVVAVGIADSRNAARRLIGDGGVSLNNVKMNDAEYALTADDFLHGEVAILKRGRKFQAAARRAG